MSSYQTHTSVGPINPGIGNRWIMSAAFLSATGFGNLANASDAFDPYVANRIPVERIITNLSLVGVESRDPIEHLKNIKSTLKLATSDIARQFNITRQSVYKWLNGEALPERQKAEKIRELSLIADQFVAANIGNVGNLVTAKAFDGCSLLDLLKDGKPSSREIAALIEIGKKARDEYRSSSIHKVKSVPEPALPYEFEDHSSRV